MIQPKQGQRAGSHKYCESHVNHVNTFHGIEASVIHIIGLLTAKCTK